MGSSEKRIDFGFAFNDKDLSDRVLHLHITQEDIESPKKSESVHISTPILAANSPFFYKLFKNEMKESAQKDVTLMINSVEELNALMDVLGFMYKKTLQATTSSELLAVLGAASKFEVTSCVEYCIQALLKLPVSVELAVVFIDLPPSLLTSEVVQPLVDTSKKVLAAEYMDFTESEDKALELPLSAIKFVLTIDGLRVKSEDLVFDFVLKWTLTHYPTVKQRQETLTEHLLPLIHFQNMSYSKLNEVLVCTDIEHKHVSKLVTKAMTAKEETPYGQHLYPSKGDGLARRAYKNPLVKVVQLEFLQPRCVVYLNLRRDECATLFPSKQLISQSFVLGGQSFFLLVECLSIEFKKQEPHGFGLFLNGLSNVDYELAVMSKSSNDFQYKLIEKNRKLGGGGWGLPNLLGISWDEFMNDNSDYFINDTYIFRLRLPSTTLIETFCYLYALLSCV